MLDERGMVSNSKDNVFAFKEECRSEREDGSDSSSIVSLEPPKYEREFFGSVILPPLCSLWNLESFNKETSGELDVALFDRVVSANLDKISKQDENGDTPLHVACKKGNKEALKVLLRYVDSFKPQKRTEIFEMLNANFEAVLEVAVKSKQTECVELILASEQYNGVPKSDEKDVMCKLIEELEYQIKITIGTEDHATCGLICKHIENLKLK